MIGSASQPAAAVHGCAELVFARRGAHTVLAHSRVEAPMSVIRPFALADGRVVVQLITLGPGLCGGDAIHVDVTAEAGARVVVTTTAATRVMTMDPRQHAEQHVRLRAADDTTLEYYPAVTIPFPASALRQTVSIVAVGTARVGAIECWALGRAARGEYAQFRSLSSRTTLTVDGRLAYADAMELEPAACDIANAGILTGRRYVAAGFWHGVSGICDDDLGCGDVAFGQSAPGLVYLRALADDAPALDAVLRRSVERVSDAWALPAVRLDRFRC